MYLFYAQKYSIPVQHSLSVKLNWIWLIWSMKSSEKNNNLMMWRWAYLCIVCICTCSGCIRQNGPFPSPRDDMPHWRNVELDFLWQEKKGANYRLWLPCHLPTLLPPPVINSLTTTVSGMVESAPAVGSGISVFFISSLKMQEFIHLCFNWLCLSLCRPPYAFTCSTIWTQDCKLSPSQAGEREIISYIF